jgi:N6-L-threonylcarbamoyladenine synthase
MIQYRDLEDAMALILGIETSCDETAASIVEDGRRVVSNVVASQIAKHAPFGGVVPELAAREHLTAIGHVVGEALRTAEVDVSKLSAVAVTNGPGLVPALLVGLNFAKGFAIANSLPIIGVNHFLAHIYGSFIDSQDICFEDESLYPMLALVVSGGHTSIVLLSADGLAKVVGTTLDDAAGEAFDKAAKMLNLGYPGGPIVERGSAGGDREKYKFPRSLTGTAGKALDPENRFNFSFSGVKTALLYHARAHGGPEKIEGQLLHDSLASYQEAIVDVLCSKAFDAAAHFDAKSAVLAGGVACNGALRERFEKSAPSSIRVIMAPRKYCTDNAAMVAGLAYHHYAAGLLDDINLDAFARLPQMNSVPVLWRKGRK